MDGARNESDFLGAFGLLERDEGVLLVSNRRVIDGVPRPVWDLPGGGIERRETLKEALVREMREETGLEATVGELLFVAEGERIHDGRRSAVWRSFFFAIEARGTPRPGAEILDLRFVPRDRLPGLLDAPYHEGFVTWLASGGDHPYVFDRWVD